MTNEYECFNEDKEGFILYTGYRAVINKLPNEFAGILFKALLEYQSTGKEIEMPLEVEIAFGFIQNQIRVDNNKRNVRKIQNRINGAKGGNPKFKKGQPNPYYQKDNQNITEDNPETSEDKPKGKGKSKNKEKGKIKSKEKYLKFPDIEYTNLTQEQFDKLKDKHGENKLLKAITIFEAWLLKGSKNAEAIKKNPHWGHFRIDSWVWEKADEMMKKERAINNNGISNEFGCY